MPIGNVPNVPDYAEVRKAQERVQTAKDLAEKEAAERAKRKKEMDVNIDASNRRKGESSQSR